MKLQVRFALLLALVFFAIGSLLVLQRSFDLERSQQVLTSELNQRRNLFSASVEAEGQTFQTFSEDYSFWDEMVAYVKTGDASFARTNIDSGLNTFGADAAWVFRPDNSLLYAAKPEGGVTVPTFEFPSTFFDNLDSKKFSHFYMRVADDVIELRAATIVPGNDPKHDGAAQGYLVIGRYLNKTYTDKIGKATDASVRLTDASAADKVQGDIASFSIPLDDWEGNTVARLGSTIKINIINDLNGLYKREFFMLVGFSAVVISMLSVAIYLLILRPIRKISEAIKDQHPELLEPVVRGGGQFGSLAAVVQEFFEQKVVIAERGVKQAELEKLNKDKASFLAVAAHELKGPIAIIKLLAEDLPKRLPYGSAPDIAKQLDIITHQATKVSTLVNDLRLAGEGREATIYNTSTFDFDSFLQKEVEEMAFITDQPLILVGETHASVTADAERLAQVVSNLIRNAAKYSPKTERIHITSSLADGRITVEFRDHGVGISVEDQQHIFERFYRAPSVIGSFQGLGLGLSISQNIIEHFGGKIWLTSTIGEGSSFFISLPVAPAQITKIN